MNLLIEKAILFALEIGRVASKESVSTEKSSLGVGSVFLRSADGSLLATISTRAIDVWEEEQRAAQEEKDQNETN